MLVIYTNLPHFWLIVSRYFYYFLKILELKNHGVEVSHNVFFDTIKVRPKNITDFEVKCQLKKINVRRYTDGCVGISLDETTLADDVRDLLFLFDVYLDVVFFIYFFWEERAFKILNVPEL